MKILYGVQGTGNGHISRSRAMAFELQLRGIEVDFIFSGRPPEQYFDMEIFGDYRCFNGLTFATEKGRVNYLKTLTASQPVNFWHETKALDLGGYDLVITDFEPVSAWAARLAKIPTLGVGHQYAFNYPIPRAGETLITRKVMQYFAPTRYSLGLHWHHFDQPILPPIVAHDSQPSVTNNAADFILVYLPFEDSAAVIQLLQGFSNTRFTLYSNTHPAGDFGNISVHPLSRAGFATSLQHCQGVICNTGFELISEALTLGKPILSKPLARQMEQLSNAVALERLQLGTIMTSLEVQAVEFWLDRAAPVTVYYPNVTGAICDWLLAAQFEHIDSLCHQLWQQTCCPQHPALFATNC